MSQLAHGLGAQVGGTLKNANQVNGFTHSRPMAGRVDPHPSQAPSPLEAPTWRFRILSEALLDETVRADNGLHGYHKAATRPS